MAPRPVHAGPHSAGGSCSVFSVFHRLIDIWSSSNHRRVDEQDPVHRYNGASVSPYRKAVLTQRPGRRRGEVGSRVRVGPAWSPALLPAGPLLPGVRGHREPCACRSKVSALRGSCSTNVAFCHLFSRHHTPAASRPVSPPCGAECRGWCLPPPPQTPPLPLLVHLLQRTFGPQPPRSCLRGLYAVTASLHFVRTKGALDGSGAWTSHRCSKAPT